MKHNRGPSAHPMAGTPTTGHAIAHLGPNWSAYSVSTVAARELGRELGRDRPRVPWLDDPGPPTRRIDYAMRYWLDRLTVCAQPTAVGVTEIHGPSGKKAGGKDRGVPLGHAGTVRRDRRDGAHDVAAPAEVEWLVRKYDNCTTNAARVRVINAAYREWVRIAYSPLPDPSVQWGTPECDARVCELYNDGKGLKQEALAEAFGKSQPMISRAIKRARENR